MMREVRKDTGVSVMHDVLCLERSCSTGYHPPDNTLDRINTKSRKGTPD